MYCNVDQLGEEDHLHCKALTSILARFTVIIIIITLLTCQVCLAEGKPSTNRGHLIDN